MDSSSNRVNRNQSFRELTVGKEDLPKKPLPRERCSIIARAAIKQAKKEGKEPLCASCEVQKFTMCPATGHAICSKRKDIGWVPVPFTTAGCGLYLPKEKAAVA